MVINDLVFSLIINHWRVAITPEPTCSRKALVSADIQALLEPVGSDRTDGKRPDGAAFIPWKM